MKNGMRNKLLGLCSIMLLMLTQCKSQPTATEGAVVIQPTRIENTTSTPNSSAEYVAPNITLVPTPTLTEGQQLARKLIKPGGQVTFSTDDCGEVYKTQGWCSVVKSAVRVTRPEWEELFPQAEFFVVKRDVYGGELVRQHNMLIVEQDGQRYNARSFRNLLKASGVTDINDDNRELIAKSFALMALPDYLAEEIVFSDWREGSWNSSTRLNHNYQLMAWTKLMGLKTVWRFTFYEGRLIEAQGGLLETKVGDYIDVPLNRLPPPSLEDLSYYWGK